MIDPENMSDGDKLRPLAEMTDHRDDVAGDLSSRTVQKDLRRMADRLDLADYDIRYSRSELQRRLPVPTITSRE